MAEASSPLINVIAFCLAFCQFLKLTTAGVVRENTINHLQTVGRKTKDLARGDVDSGGRQHKDDAHRPAVVASPSMVQTRTSIGRSDHPFSLFGKPPPGPFRFWATDLRMR